MVHFPIDKSTDLAPDEINMILAEEKKHLKAVLSKQADAAVKLLML